MMSVSTKIAVSVLLLFAVSHAMASKLDPEDYDYYRQADGTFPSNTVVLQGFIEVVEGLPVSALLASAGSSAVDPAVSVSTNTSGPGYEEHIAHMFVIVDEAAADGSVASTSRYQLDFSAFADQTGPAFPRTFLKSDDVIRLEVAVDLSTFPAKAQVYAVGLISRLAGVEDGVDPVYAARSSTTTMKVLWVLMNFADGAAVCSRTQVDSMIFSGSPNMVDMYNTMSNGRTQLEKKTDYMNYHVAGPFTFSQFSITQNCNSYVYQWQTAAASAAYNAGYDLSKYGTLAMVVPRMPTCYWAGLASFSNACQPYTTTASTKPRCFAALNYCLPFAFMHELGHNLYMHHSATDTADGTTYSSSNEYTDWSCLMGNQNSWNNVNAPKLYAQGWLDSNKVLVDTPGALTLSTTDMPSANAQYPQVVMINVPSTNKHYYLAFRMKQNSGRWLSTKYASLLNIHYTVDSSAVSRYVASVAVGGSYLLKGINWRVVVKSVSGNNMQIVIFPCDTTTSCSSYTWQSSSWSSCSATCGTGTQTRSAICVDTSASNNQVDNSFCDSSLRPTTSATCNTQSCAVPAWLPGDWSACSSVCGGGQRTRSVGCVLSGVSQADSVCASLSKPTSSETCNTNPCFGWDATAWSSCSAVCGVGTQSRDVRCAQLDSNNQPVSTVTESFCVTSLKPGSVRSCDAGPCSYGWFSGPWSMCSSPCNGTATRDVQCRQQGSTDAVDVSHCVAADRPASSKKCGAPLCCREGFGGVDCRLRAFSIRLGPLAGLESSAVVGNGAAGWDQFSASLVADIASALSISQDRIQPLSFDGTAADRAFVEFSLVSRNESDYSMQQSVMPDGDAPMSVADLLGLYGSLAAQALNRNSALYSGQITSHLVFSAVAPNDPSTPPSTPDTPNTSGGDSGTSGSTVGMAVGVSVGGAALVAIVAGTVYLFRRKRRASSERRAVDVTSPHSEVELRAA